MTRTALPIALALLVLLSGCNGILADTETATPTAETSETPASDVTLPPGVTEDGVESPFDLASAHQRVASNTSHVVTKTVTVRYENESEAHWNLTRRHDAQRGTSLLTQTTTGPPSTYRTQESLEIWTNETVSVGMADVGDDQVFFRPTGGYVHNPGVSGLPALFLAVETDVTGTTQRGESLVHLVGTDVLSAEGLDPIARNVSNVSLSAAVRPSGLVTQYSLGYDATLDGTAVRITETYQFDRRASVRADRPPWVSEAVVAVNQ